MVTFRISVLLPIKSWTFWTFWTPSYVIIWKSYTLLKMVQFFWPTLYISHSPANMTTRNFSVPYYKCDVIGWRSDAIGSDFGNIKKFASPGRAPLRSGLISCLHTYTCVPLSPSSILVPVIGRWRCRGRKGNHRFGDALATFADFVVYLPRTQKLIWGRWAPCLSSLVDMALLYLYFLWQ